ncbi:MAG: hypothetical protein AAF335_02425 [Bacteroidota bacterium]
MITPHKSRKSIYTTLLFTACIASIPTTQTVLASGKKYLHVTVIHKNENPVRTYLLPKDTKGSKLINYIDINEEWWVRVTNGDLMTSRTQIGHIKKEKTLGEQFSNALVEDLDYYKKTNNPQYLDDNGKLKDLFSTTQKKQESARSMIQTLGMEHRASSNH